MAKLTPDEAFINLRNSQAKYVENNADKIREARANYRSTPQAQESAANYYDLNVKQDPDAMAIRRETSSAWRNDLANADSIKQSQDKASAWRNSPEGNSIYNEQVAAYRNIPEVRQKIVSRQYDARSTNKMIAQDDRINANDEIHNRINMGDEQIGDQSQSGDIEKIIARQGNRFNEINKNAVENLYETNPEYVGQFGQGQVGAMAGALAVPAIQYANEATHNQFNPVAIQGAGEGSDTVPQDPNAGYNSLSRQYLQNKYGRQ